MGLSYKPDLASLNALATAIGARLITRAPIGRQVAETWPMNIATIITQ